jgi:Ca2+-binding RTX toxin-like protein
MCSSEKVGGNDDDTLASSGKCNDQLTGGQGADKFICGEGKDTIKDYNSKEGDVILDPPELRENTLTHVDDNDVF